MTRNLSPDVATQAHNIAALVKTAGRMVGEGKSVDLSALEGRVRALRDAVGETAPADAAALRGILAGVIADLDRLAAGLAERHRKLSAGLAGDARHQALDAYGGTDRRT